MEILSAKFCKKKIVDNEHKIKLIFFIHNIWNNFWDDIIFTNILTYNYKIIYILFVLILCYNLYIHFTNVLIFFFIVFSPRFYFSRERDTIPVCFHPFFFLWHCKSYVSHVNLNVLAEAGLACFKLYSKICKGIAYIPVNITLN